MINKQQENKTIKEYDQKGRMLIFHYVQKNNGIVKKYHINHKIYYQYALKHGQTINTEFMKEDDGRYMYIRTWENNLFNGINIIFSYYA